MPAVDEEQLNGGNASELVVRVGATVRKPWQPSTPRVMKFLTHLKAQGLDVPAPHGADERGRFVLDYVPGVMALDVAPLPVEVVGRVGALIRQIHDASADVPVPDDWEVLLPSEHPDLVCHNDLATWNLVLDGERLVFIDWDGAGPSTRGWDLAYAAISFGHLFPGADVARCAERLGALVDGYNADDTLRALLPGTLAARARAMVDLLRRSHAEGREPWGSMHVAGHGEHWAGTVAFVIEHQEVWRRAISGTRGVARD